MKCKTVIKLKSKSILGKAVLLLLLCIVSLTSLAQDKVKYAVLSDNPDTIPSNYYYLFAFDAEGGLLATRHAANGVLGSSVNFWQEIGSSIGVEGNFKLAFAGDAVEKVKLPLKIDAGVFYRLSSKLKQKDIDVDVKSFKTKVDVEDNSGRYIGSVDAVGVKQISVPATYKIQRSVHGGLAYQNGTYDRQQDGIGTYKSLGLYVGIVQESKVGLSVLLKDRVARSNQYMRMYADVMFWPVANATIPEGKVSRVGMRIGAVGSYPRANNYLRYLAPKVELGYHAMNGVYFQVGVGATLFNY